MEYPIIRSTLVDAVDALVAREAALSRSGTGASQYDEVRLTSRDGDVLAGMLSRAVRAVLSRFSDVATLERGPVEGLDEIPPGGVDYIDFLLPDMDPATEPAAKEALDGFMVNSTVSWWLEGRGQRSAERYAALAKLDMETAVRTMRQRTNQNV